ncbi:MAG: RES domain-containing protein [Gemmatimonadota bacterium]|nr:MAG: RES domain-containing protein [Gemmatimonadota bacterium]UCH25438.1 MAG: RES domain-containing protein [Trueperaceae bacterium]
MTLQAYRLTKAIFADRAFDGEGARLNGGRWNPAGIPVVYLADSLPLAVLETLVHLERSRVLDAFVWFEVIFADALVLGLPAEELPHDWQANPEPASTVAIGEAWARRRASLLLRVPSAVVPQNKLYLLNPAHPDFGSVEITGPFPFTFDQRLS